MRNKLSQESNIAFSLNDRQENSFTFSHSFSNFSMPSINMPIPLYHRHSQDLKKEQANDKEQYGRESSTGLNPGFQNFVNFDKCSNFQKVEQTVHLRLSEIKKTRLSAKQCKRAKGENNQQLEFFDREDMNLSQRQNLKIISVHIYKLICLNGPISYKSLTNLLFEIVGETSFGMDLINDYEYRLPNKETVEKDLMKIYSKKHCQEHKQKNLIKNVRRRLYDAINVLISSKIIKRNMQGLLVFSQIKKYSQTFISEGRKTSLVQSRQLLNIKQRVNKKKKDYQDLKKKYEIIKKTYERNQASSSVKIEQDSEILNKKIGLPILMVQKDDNMILSTQRQIFEIKSTTRQLPRFFSDLECFDILANYEIQTCWQADCTQKMEEEE